MEEHLHIESLIRPKPDIKQVSLLYFVTILLFLFVGSRVQRFEFYSGILITEFLLVAAPALVMLYIFKYDVKYTLRLNRISVLNLFIILCIMLFAIPVTGVLNLVNLSVIKLLFGRAVVQQPPVAVNALGLLVNVLVVGGSAGICEEIMFRGAIQRGFEKVGTAKAILITSFLFGLMHVDFQKLLGTFLLGGLIGFIVYRTNSLYGGMFAHFCNNSLAVLIAYGAGKLRDIAGASSAGTNIPYSTDVDFSAIFDLPPVQLIAVIVVWGFIFLFCISVLVGLIIALIRNTEKQVEKVQKQRDPANLLGAFWLLPPFCLIALIYFAQGLGLTGVRLAWLDMVLRFIGMR